MILLPLVALVMLSYGELSRLRDDSNSAHAAATHIDRVVPLGQLMFHLELEQMLTAATIHLVSAGVSPESVRVQYGFDIATMLKDSRDQVDRRVDDIARADLPLAGETVGLMVRVINVRPAVDRNTATIEQIERDFGAARTALARVAQGDFDIASAGFAELPDAMRLIGQYRSTQLLFDLVASQAHGLFAYGNFILPALRTDTDRLNFAAAVTQKQTLLPSSTSASTSHNAPRGPPSPRRRHSPPWCRPRTASCRRWDCATAWVSTRRRWRPTS